MSTMKHGFSTLNRWLGKKNKDKNAVSNGKLSKSSTNLSTSISAMEISEPSQLEYNRITPLPAATSNAPFEQTFRITVLLPKDQLYVTRVGARLPLSTLLKMVCENKLLDQQKYEFRNPVDASQVYGNELTIGSVGLSEVRLCHKTDSYANFNSEEVLKMQRTTIMRESLSSSEYSSRNSKHANTTTTNNNNNSNNNNNNNNNHNNNTNKTTTSPYSSSNSLNSMDSAGVNYTYTPISPPPTTLSVTTQPKMMAPPPRKKRAAPRPPSQIVIPEKSALSLENWNGNNTVAIVTNHSSSSMPQKGNYISTPDLTLPASASMSSGSGTTTPIVSNNNNNNDDSNEYVVDKNTRNLYGGSVQNLSMYQQSSDTEAVQKFPEPSPRKRLLNIKKKSAPAAPAAPAILAAAAPPPPTPGQRSSAAILYSEDTISIASTISTSGPYPETPKSISNQQEITLTAPQELNEKPEIVPNQLAFENNTITTTPTRNTPPNATLDIIGDTSTSSLQQQQQLPKPVPRSTTLTMLNAPTTTDAHNVSKVMLNRTPTPEPRSLSTEPPMDVTPGASLTTTINDNDNYDNISKQADSGIGEPIPSPLLDSVPSEDSTHEKSTFESSSDDDDMIKVYNFKLGKTTIKPMCDGTTLDDLTTITAVSFSTDENRSDILETHDSDDLSTPIQSEATSWNFSVPLSPPPNFADKDIITTNSNSNNNNPSKSIPIEEDKEIFSDIPITPKIKQRPVLNFDSFVVPSKEMKDSQQRSITPMSSPVTPINTIVDELNSVLNGKAAGVDSLIRQHNDQSHIIESAKPNTLANFTITPISKHHLSSTSTSTNTSTTSPVEISTKSTINITTIDRKLISNDDNRGIGKTLIRADSFHTPSTMVTNASIPLSNITSDGGGMTSRSSSYISLTKIEQNGFHNGHRRSSSELSIGESPALQSPDIIKTILNSRKNSLANSSEIEAISSNIINNKIITNELTDNLDSNVQAMVNEPKMNNDNTINILETNITTATTIAAVEIPDTKLNTNTKAIETPIYRYTGPPSINFSTWNERPKAQVSIKNEGDYIFGGKNANNSNAAVTHVSVEINTQSMPRNYRASMPAIASKPNSVTQRMGIPEKEYSIPIMVKPLKDVTIESNNVIISKKIDKTDSPKMNSPISDTQNYYRSTLSRTNRTSMPSPSAQMQKQAQTPIQEPIKLLTVNRSSEEITQKMQENKSTTLAPFGQNTLRKTGLKEKIIAMEEAADVKPKMNNQQDPNSSPTNTNIVTKKIFDNVNIVKKSSTSSSPAIKSNHTPQNAGQSAQQASSIKEISNSTRTFKSAKLELKLQNAPNGKTQSTTAVTPIQSTPIQLAQLARTPQSAPILSSNNQTPTPTPPPPPPPSMPITVSRKVASKSVGSTPTTPMSDPRDALLEAIRNFKRDELHRT